MCLAVPAKLSDCHGGEAIAEMHGNRVRVSTILVPEAVDGDWVLVHAGFAIQRLDAKEAQETFAVLEDVQKASDGATPGKKRRSDEGK
jgi:hydrogenase expression/formation protein HypC